MKSQLITIAAAMTVVTTAFAGPIHDAVIFGDLAGVQAELDKGADVNAKDPRGTTPLHGAALRGHKEIAELLIAKGVDVNAKKNDGETPLDTAIRRKKPEVADLLRKQGGKTGEELKAEGK
ncbi:ankyrin repeat domain-containing protein [bacterium]|nr:ankyrin repeat domain-containing protein [bacterium]